MTVKFSRGDFPSAPFTSNRLTEREMGEFYFRKIEKIESTIDSLVVKICELGSSKIVDVSKYYKEILNDIFETNILLMDLKSNSEFFEKTKTIIKLKLLTAQSLLEKAGKDPLSSEFQLVKAQLGILGEGISAVVAGEDRSAEELREGAAVERDEKEAREKGVSSPSKLDFVSGNVQGGVDRVTQFKVLQQVSDGEVSGLEFCGFHALKNALVALHSVHAEGNLNLLFNDPKLFKVFYERYGAPLVGFKSAGSRDATSPIVREIIQKFKNDVNPPAELILIQKSLRALPDYLTVFEVRPEDGTFMGELALANVEEESLEDVQRLCRFANATGPLTIALVVGNHEDQHWHTVVFYKDEKGNIKSFGGDSMQNDHSIVGELSPLLKISRYFMKKLLDPKAFLQETFQKTTIPEILSRQAGWVRNGDNRRQLLDEKPCASLARSGFDGSFLQANIQRLLLCSSVMQQAHCFSSLDFSIQSSVSDLEVLLNFYISNLPLTHPFQADLRRAREVIMRERSVDWLGKMYTQMFDEINAQRRKLEFAAVSPALLERAFEVFNKVLEIYRNIERITEIDSSDARNVLINSIATMAEGEFSAGKTPGQVRENLLEKAFFVVNVYQKAKKKNKVAEFCKAISVGGCPQNRLDSARLFEETLDIGPVEEMISTFKMAAMPLSTVIEFACGDMDPQSALDFIKGLSRASFKSAAMQQNLIIWFSTYYSNASTYDADFYNFLLTEKLIESVESLNWEELIPKLVDHPRFEELLTMAKSVPRL